MYLAEVVPLTKTPLQRSQTLSYFSAQVLAVGCLVLVPLGRRQEKAAVVANHEIAGRKMEIKDAEYELRPIKKVLSETPIFTKQQIELALWLGEYYFVSPGAFLKMMMPKKVNSKQLTANRENKNQILILVPTVSQIDILAKKVSPARRVLIHSGLKAKDLSQAWQKIASGQAQIIIGTRLAVFAPFCNLKKITIEDETNPVHYSWDMFPHYRVHEITKKLAEIFNAKLILKSIVPSIESHYLSSDPQTEKNPDLRYAVPGLAPSIIDLRQELRDGNFSIFSRQLQDEILQTLKNKQQVILFINRRGLATFVLCRDCGYVEKCASCEAPLTYHLIKSGELQKPILICHHCGKKSQPPSLCPKCQSSRIKAFGTGTQRVEQEAQKLFKDAKILRLDSDTAPDAIQQNKIIEEFRQKKADILIGTQMILNADIPKVPLVAIISADTLMHLPDFRSDEKMFQTIAQLKNLLFCHSRESGNPDHKLQVSQKTAGCSFIIQTYNPSAAALKYAAVGRWDAFYKQEIETRQALKYPPFSQLIKLVFRHRDPAKAANEAKILSAKLTQQLKTSKPPHFLDQTATIESNDEKTILPPTTQLHDLKCGGKILNEAVFEISDAVPAFIARQKSRYIWQIIIKAKPYWLAKQDEHENLLRVRNKLLMFVPHGWEIDIDPQTLL
ncbi:MAG: primosomal protein N' [bacterium]